MFTQNFRLSPDDELVDTDKLSLNMYVSDIGLPTAPPHAAAGFRITHHEQLRILKEIFSQVAVRNDPNLSDGQSTLSPGDQPISDDALNLEFYKESAHRRALAIRKKLANNSCPDFNSQMALVDSLLQRVLEHPAVTFWLARLYYRDATTSDHCCNVAIYCLQMGLNAGLKTQALESLGVAAILHDLGKFFIEQDILQKPSALTDTEYDLVRTHSNWGYSLLVQDTRLPEGVVAAVLQHHERVDGRGYPAQLSESEIHPFAKIVAVADAFDAMTSQRPYNRVKTFEEALQVLEQQSNRQFDAATVGYFVPTIRAALNGNPDQT